MAGRGVDIIPGGPRPECVVFEEVKDHILKETLHFIDQGVSLLKEHGASKDWPADRQGSLNQTKDTIIHQESTMTRMWGDYARASIELDANRSSEIMENIKQQEQALQKSLETYVSFIEERSHYIKKELEDYSSKDGKPAIQQKTKALIDANDIASQGSRTIGQIVLDQTQLFLKWLERHMEVRDLGGLHVLPAGV